MVRELGEIDGRSMPAVRYRRLLEQLVEDLGGLAALSAAQLELARRAGGLGVLATKIEAQILEDHAEADLERYIQACHAQARVLTALGLRRRARTVNGTIL
jgi:hypothetical protein